MINLKNVAPKILKVLFFSYLVIALAFYGTPGSTIYANLLGVLLSVTFFTKVWSKEVELFFPFPIKILIIFMVYSILSTIIFSTSWTFLFTIFQVIMLIIIIYSLLYQFNLDDSYYWAITLGCLTIIFIQVIDGRPLLAFNVTIINRIGATAGNVNDYAFFLCTAINLILFSFYVDTKKKKIFFGNILKLIIILLFVMEISFLTLSKSGIILMSLSIIYFIYLFNKNSVTRKILAGIVVFIIYLVVNPNFILENFAVFARFTGMYDTLFIKGLSYEDGSTIQRLSLIKDGVRLWSERPLFGWGPGQYRWINNVDFGYYSHNNFIELLVNFGLLGFSLFYSIHLYIFRELLKLKKMKQRSNEVNWLLLMLFSLLIFDLTAVTYYNKIYFLNLAFILVKLKHLEKYFKLKKIINSNLN